jgi:hypothetical protein
MVEDLGRRCEARTLEEGYTLEWLFRQAELMERQASERIRAAVPVVEVRIVIERSR